MGSELSLALEIRIEATPESVWHAMTTEIGQWWISGMTMESMNLVLEPRPGGRFYRDLGNDAGHLWAHVQVIKPPKLLELVGPMFTSLPIMHHVAFRLESAGTGTLLKYHHRAAGPIPDEMHEHIAPGIEKFVLKGLKNHVER